jgi:hypothetical protein
MLSYVRVATVIGRIRGSVVAGDDERPVVHHAVGQRQGIDLETGLRRRERVLRHDARYRAPSARR